MISDKEFRQFLKDVADGYEHIYDLAYLRSHRLLKLLFPENHDKGAGKELVWQLHHLLIATIGELDPGPQAPVFSREWRRHRLLVLRYVDGLPPQTVADQLAISRRHFYREHDAAIEVLAELLWARQIEKNAGNPIADQPVSEQELAGPAAQTLITDRLQLIRIEAAQMTQTDHQIDLAEVMHGVLALLADKALQHGITIVNQIGDCPPHVKGNSRLLRQLLLGLVGHLITGSHDGELRLLTEFDSSKQCLKLTANLNNAAYVAATNATTLLTGFNELAALSMATLTPCYTASVLTGFQVKFDLHTNTRTVLVIDDNEDILELFQRYLTHQNFEVITIRKSNELLSIAQRVRPSVIILDLMIPDQDGWDLLQILQHHRETQLIPVIICSILPQKELALSLGATAFLEKPFSEEALASLITLVA